MQTSRLGSEVTPKGYLVQVTEDYRIAVLYSSVPMSDIEGVQAIIAPKEVLDKLSPAVGVSLTALVEGDLAISLPDETFLLIQVQEDVLTSQSWPIALGDSTHKILLATSLEKPKKSKLFIQYPVHEADLPPEEFGDVEDTTRSEKAWSFWNTNWATVLSNYSSSQNEWILHIHTRGLSEDEKNISVDDLLRTSHSVHMDLRMELPTFWWGMTIFTGRTRDNRPRWKVEGLNGTVLQVWPKYVVPKEGIKKWLTLAKEGPTSSPPGGVGSTVNSWTQFRAFDTGTYSLGTANRSFVEVFLRGKILNGRYIFQRAESEDKRFWIMRKPSDQNAYSTSHTLEETVKRLKGRGHKQILWSVDWNPPELYNTLTGQREQPTSTIKEED